MPNYLLIIKLDSEGAALRLQADLTDLGLTAQVYEAQDITDLARHAQPA